MKAPFAFASLLVAPLVGIACSKADSPALAGLAAASGAQLAGGAGPTAPAPVASAPPVRPATIVGLDGKLQSAPPASAKRLFARSLRSWIYERPSRTSERLGYFRAGAALALRGERAAVEGCAAGWYPVEPRGFVCAEGAATLDENDAVVAAYRGARCRLLQQAALHLRHRAAPGPDLHAPAQS
jgi:hypothetical protein